MGVRAQRTAFRVARQFLKDSGYGFPGSAANLSAMLPCQLPKTTLEGRQKGLKTKVQGLRNPDEIIVPRVRGILSGYRDCGILRFLVFYKVGIRLICYRIRYVTRKERV